MSRRLRPGDVLALVGELGAGKTTLVQGIVAGWGYRRGANSPTFALINEYKTTKGPIYHMDLYRLTDREREAFPFEDYWAGGLCLMEWADRIRDRWPKGTTEIRLRIEDPQVRSLKIIAGRVARR